MRSRDGELAGGSQMELVTPQWAGGFWGVLRGGGVGIRISKKSKGRQDKSGCWTPELEILQGWRTTGCTA